MSLYDLSVNLLLETAKFSTSLDRATGQLATATNTMQRQVNTVTGAFKALAAAYPVVVAARYTSALINQAAALDDLAESTGSSVEALSELANRARVSGVDFGTFQTLTNKLAVGLAGLDEEGKKAGEALKAMGVTSRDPAEALKQLALALEKYADGANKAANMAAIFGKGGAQYTGAIRDIAKELQTSGTVTAQFASDSEQLQKEIERLKISAEGWANSILAKVVPAINTYILRLQEARAAGLGLFKASDIASTTDEGIPRRIAQITGEIDKLEARLAKGKEQGFGAWVRDAEERLKPLRVQLELLQKMAMGDPMDPKNFVGPPAPDRRPQAPKPPGSADDKAKRDAEAAAKLMDDVMRKSAEAELALRDAFNPEPVNAVTKALIDLYSSPAWDKMSQAQKEAAVDATRNAAAQQEFVKWMEGAAKASATYAQERAREEQEWRDQQDETKQTYRDLVQSLEDEAGMVALTNDEREKAIALKKLDAEWTKGLIASEEEYIAMRDRLSAAFDFRNSAARLQDNLTKQKQAWTDAYNEIGDKITDALMRAFESGASMGKALRDTLVNMFKTLVLRPMIQGVLAPVAGAFAGGAQAAGPGGINPMSMFGGGGGFNIFGAGPIGAGGFLGAGGISGLFSGSGGIMGAGGALNGFAMSGAGQALGLSAAGLDAAGGLALTGLGTALGTAIPVIGAVLAIASMAGVFDKKGGPKSGASGFAGVGDASRFFTPNDEDAAATAMATASLSDYDRFVKMLGGSGKGGFKYGWDQDPEGSASSRARLSAYVNGQQVFGMSQDVGRDPKAIEQALKDNAGKALLAALKASDLPKSIAKAMNLLDANSASNENIEQFVVAISQLGEVFAADPLKDADKAFKAATATAYDGFMDTAAALREVIDANDTSITGLQKLAGATQNYYKAQVQLLVQIESVRRSMQSMFGNSIRDMTLSTLSDDEKGAFYRNSFDSGVQKLLKENDPAKIADLLAQLNEDMTSAFNLLSPEEQKRMLPEYIKEINKLQELADARLTTVKDTIADAAKDVLNEVQVMLDAAADKMAAAANTQQTAADTALQAANTPVTVIVQQEGYEVGGGG